MTLSPAILDSQEYARRLVLKLDGSVLPYDEDLGGFTIDTATPIFVTRGTAAARAALSGDPGQLFYETDTSVLLEWTNAAAWKAVAAPGAWTSASYPTPANTDAAYEGLRVYETDTGKTVVFRRTTLGVAIGGGNPLIWIQVSPVTTTGIDITGVGTTASPFVGAVRNQKQLANPVRNASMVVTQRGQTFAVGATTPFTIDSWRTFRNAVATGLTVTTQVSEDSQGSAFSMRLQRDSGNTSVEPIYAQQSCESVECRRFRNRTATISARIRVGANYSGGSTAALQLITGTGSSQSLASGFTGQATALTVGISAPTTSWATVTGTVALGSITQFGVQAAYTPSGTAGAADWLEIKDVRVDEGAYAQEHVPLPYAQDLAECQRFFYRQGGVGNFDFHGNAYVATATIASLAVQFPVTMRAVPTLSVSAVGGLVANDGSVAPVSTAIALSGAVNGTTSRTLVNVTCGAGGLTVGRGCMVFTGGTAANGILDFSAEI